MEQAARAEPCPGAGVVPAAVPARCRLPSSPHVMVSPRWGRPRWPGDKGAGATICPRHRGRGPERVSVPCAGDVPAERGQGVKCPGGDGIWGVCQSRDEIQGASGVGARGVLMRVPCRAGRRPRALVTVGTVLGAGPWGSVVLPAHPAEPEMAFCSWKVQLSPLKSILRAWAELVGSSGHL